MPEDPADWLDTIRQMPPGPPLPLPKKVCGNCAVKCGFYREFSDALKLAPPGEQLERSKGWLCEHAKGVACKGNADNLGLKW